MYKGLDIYTFSDYVIHRCGEGNINDLVSILELEAKKIYLTNDVINRSTNIKKLYIRDKLFNYVQEFYILKDNEGNIISILGLSDLSNKYINKYVIDLFNIYKNISDDILVNFIEKSINDLKSIYKECIKISIYIEENNMYSKELSNLMQQSGFEHYGTLKNEYGLNKNQLIYEKILK